MLPGHLEWIFCTSPRDMEFSLSKRGCGVLDRSDEGVGVGPGSDESTRKTRRSDEQRDGTGWARYVSLRGPFGIKI